MFNNGCIGVQPYYKAVVLSYNYESVACNDPPYWLIIYPQVPPLVDLYFNNVGYWLAK